MSKITAQMLKAAKAELRRREERAALKADCEKDLMAFVEAFWPVVEPATPLIKGWVLEAMCDILMAAADGQIRRLCLNVPPGSMKSTLLNVFFPAWLWGAMNKPHLRFISASYSTMIPERDNSRLLRVLQSELFRQFWGDRVQIVREGVGLIETSSTGSKRVVSTDGGTTGHRADFLLLDDINNPTNVESDTVRHATNHWLREVMPDRLNDLKRSVIINIQQRTHEQDATGTLLQFGYLHVVIPLEFDPGRFQHVVLRRNKAGEATQVWADPRGLDKDGNELEGLVEKAHGGLEAAPGSPMAQAEGTLCWPERYPPDEMEKMRNIKGPYAWACNTGEAPILMADLSMKPLSEIRVGDAIVGFEASCDPRRDGEKFGRRRLMKTTVEDVHVSVRPVVKITLDSGRVIRCTPDHKWYTGRTPNDKSHPVYAAAKLKRALIRVCDPFLPDITDVETARMAGWLSGFYEGEGTVVFQSRRPGYAKNAVISFYQGCEDNLPICDELERVLTHFGFEYGISERKRTKSHWQKARIYWLKRGGLPLLQRFLHIVRPIKWRERIIEAAFASNFVRGEERVVSIEPDGEDVVYGLTTGTGNYVVWGLASSNSQYLQSPTVRGGAIIRREWWRRWRGMVLPEFGTVIASLDTAIKEGKENDFNALTILGAFADDEGAPQFMLADAWRVRTNLADLVRMVGDACRKHNVDYLLIEDKARGHDVAAEIRRLYASAPWDTCLLKIGGGRYAQDKVTRVMAVTPMFSGPVRKDPATGMDIWEGGMVWAPEAEWAEEVIAETTSFPRGAHDDYVDCLGQMLLWARKTGLAITKAEFRETEDEAMQYQRPVGVPYAIHGPANA